VSDGYCLRCLNGSAIYRARVRFRTVPKNSFIKRQRSVQRSQESPSVIPKKPEVLDESSRPTDLPALGQLDHKKKPILQVIRGKCLDCCCGSKKEVRLCPVTLCPLYPYRLGKNPFYAKGGGQKSSKIANLKHR
jgi:hypothetical protein